MNRHTSKQPKTRKEKKQQSKCQPRRMRDSCRKTQKQKSAQARMDAMCAGGRDNDPKTKHYSKNLKRQSERRTQPHRLFRIVPVRAPSPADHNQPPSDLARAMIGRRGAGVTRRGLQSIGQRNPFKATSDRKPKGVVRHRNNPPPPCLLSLNIYIYIKCMMHDEKHLTANWRELGSAQQ